MGVASLVVYTNNVAGRSHSDGDFDLAGQINGSWSLYQFTGVYLNGCTEGMKGATDAQSLQSDSKSKP